MATARGRPYLAPIMSFFRYIAPVRAYRDLRLFLSTRQRYELWFLALSLFLTGLAVWALFKDSHFERAYKRNIIYVENWRADRSDAEIKAKQVVDQARREKLIAEMRAREEKRKAEFKRVDDALKRYGI